jgi:protein-tyrosine phosphatase
MIKVLFVCMGNICRSPTAEGVFRHSVEQAGLSGQIHIDSAGTHAYHIGNPPDERARQAALRRGIDLSKLRARQVTRKDLDEFDYILAMDAENHRRLRELGQPEHAGKIHFLLDFAPSLNHKEVPDPYYGGAEGFECVLDLTTAAAQGLLADIRQRWQGEINAPGK